MELVKKIESALEGAFKDLPKLPESMKESLVKAWPWIALILGILQLSAAWLVWKLASAASRWDRVVDYYYGVDSGLSSTDKMFIYLGAIVLLVDAVVLLLAFPQLQKRTRRGWWLVFISALINIAYAVVSIFIDGRGFGSFVGNLVGSAIGFYLLFQIKDKYFGKVKKSEAKE